MDLSGPADLIKQEKYPEDAPPKDESIPLPPKINQDVMEEIAQIQTLRDRIQISNHHLPSILTYTLHNTFGICNQVRVNEEATRMVGAMADSTVRVWSLTDEPLRSLKAATEFSVDDFENGRRSWFTCDHNFILGLILSASGNDGCRTGTKGRLVQKTHWTFWSRV